MLYKGLLGCILIIFTVAGCRNNRFTSNEIVCQSDSCRFSQLQSYYTRSDDSLKRKALDFLIMNHKGKSGVQSLNNLSNIKLYNYIITKKKIRDYQYIDSLYQVMEGNFHVFHSLFDCETISQELLIENIEYAFLAWELPWAKHLSFEEFCQYILPYRIMNEPVSNWRKYIFDMNKRLIDSLVKDNTVDPVLVCKKINKDLYNRFVFVKSFSEPFPEITELYDHPLGNCIHRYLLYTAISRSLGLPVAIDFVQQFHQAPGEHSWTTLTNDGKDSILAFNGGDEWDEFPYSGIKIYRNVFSYDKKKITPNTPKFLTREDIRDVTAEYLAQSTDLRIPVANQMNTDEVYLGVFGIGEEIKYLARGKIIDGEIIFNNLDLSSDAFLLFYKPEGDTIKPIGSPFLYRPKWQNEYKIPSETFLEKVRLYRKYPIQEATYNYAKQIEGAKIQGSNHEDFRDSKDLYEFDQVPKVFTEIDIKATEDYAYYRYLPAETSEIHLAELQFWLNNKDETQSAFLGSNKVHNFPADQLAVKYSFDQNIRTNIDLPQNTWIQVSPEDPTRSYLKKVRILPRNNFNVVERGHNYEVLLFDKQWVSCGEKIAKGTFIEFLVPSNSLLLLRDLTSGKQDRIFTYSNHQQYFW